jgi:hypothetical protein
MTDAARLPAGRGRRFCDGCGATLAADNSAHLCSKCHREKRDSLHAPPARLRNDFFETADFRAAFESQHIGKVFKAYRNHPRHLLFLGKALNQEILSRSIPRQTPSTRSQVLRSIGFPSWLQTSAWAIIRRRTTPTVTPCPPMIISVARK